MSRNYWASRMGRPPTRRIPTLSDKPAAYTTGHQYRAKGVPAGEQATYWTLAGMFRAGDLYAFSWDAQAARWDVWRTEADWLATERNGQVARPDLAELGHGPAVWEPPTTPPRATSRKATKAELVTMLRRLVDGSDWEVNELTDLLARA